MLNLPKLICYFKDLFFISLRCIVLGLDYNVCIHTHTYTHTSFHTTWGKHTLTFFLFRC
jgi:hypothetical protein